MTEGPRHCNENNWLVRRFHIKIGSLKDGTVCKEEVLDSQKDFLISALSCIRDQASQNPSDNHYFSITYKFITISNIPTRTWSLVSRYSAVTKNFTGENFQAEYSVGRESRVSVLRSLQFRWLFNDLDPSWFLGGHSPLPMLIFLSWFSVLNRRFP